MSEKVALPPGCYGLDLPGGQKVTGKPGSTVTVEDHQAKLINKSSNAHYGIVSSGLSYTVGTRHGRRCVSCHFLAQSWSTTCPRCGEETTEE